jgi:hypothetical protein
MVLADLSSTVRSISAAEEITSMEIFSSKRLRILHSSDSSSALLVAMRLKREQTISTEGAAGTSGTAGTGITALVATLHIRVPSHETGGRRSVFPSRPEGNATRMNKKSINIRA